jgi:hypothetical protein
MTKKSSHKDVDYLKLKKVISPKKSDHAFQYNFLSGEELNRLKLYAGPHGYTLFKIMEARNEPNK